MMDEERALQALVDPLVPEEETMCEWDDVLSRAEQITKDHSPQRLFAPPGFVGWRPSLQNRRRRLRSALAAGVAVAALAGAGVAIASGLGAFNGLSDTQHPRTGAAVLDPHTAAMIKNGCGLEPNPNGSGSIEIHCILDSARLLGQVPGYGNVYVLGDTQGDLCIRFERGVGHCGAPLSRSDPVVTFGANETGSDPVSFGIVMDGITAVSFQAGDQEVTVPVKDNVWYYAGASSAINDMTIHFANGSSQLLHNDAPASTTAPTTTTVPATTTVQSSPAAQGGSEH